MTQAQTNAKHPAPLGIQAATAATTASTATKPHDVKNDAKTDVKHDAKTDAKNDGKVDVKPDDEKNDDKDEDGEDKRTRVARKVYVVVGEVHEFDSVNKAEKFLNADEAPANYTVFRGNRIGTSKKVSLR